MRPRMRVTDELGKDLQHAMFCLDEKGCQDSLSVPTRLARISPVIKSDDRDRNLSEGSKQISRCTVRASFVTAISPRPAWVMISGFCCASSHVLRSWDLGVYSPADKDGSKTFPWRKRVSYSPGVSLTVEKLRRVRRSAAKSVISEGERCPLRVLTSHRVLICRNLGRRHGL